MSRKFLDSEILVSTKDMSKEEWLKHRQSGIGGSDASAVAGINPWKTAVQVYIDKKQEEVKEVKNFRMELGNRLEGFVAELFTEETGLKVRNVNGILVNEKYPFAFANIDRAIVGEKAFLECKTTNSYAAKDWENGIPAHYEIQCLHYMAITGATHCYIAALIGNQEFKWYKLERDQETIDYLMKIEKDFWENNVLKDEIPVPDGSYAYSEYLKEKYPSSRKEEIDITNFIKNAKDKLNRYDEIVADIKALDNEKKTIEQEIQAEMKDCEVAKIGDRKATWKSQSRSSIDSKKLKNELPDIASQYMNTTSFRKFSIK